MKRCLMIAICLGFAVFGHAAEPREFPLSKTLEGEGHGRGTIGWFEIDEELFDGADARSGNVRVLDNEGTTVPFLVRTVYDRRQVVTEHDIPVETLEFELLPDNRFQATIERTGDEEPRPASVLVLKSKVRNFEKTVSVWASQDRQEWEPVAEADPIYDYSRYLDLRRDRVSLVAGRHRYYRIEVSNITEEQLSPLVRIARETRGSELAGKIEHTSLRREDYRVDAIRLLERRESWSDSEPVLRDYSVANLVTEADAERKTTEVRFHVRYVPVREVRFDVTDAFFSRAVTLEGNVRIAGEEGWKRVARGTLQRLPGGDAEEGVVKLPNNANACRYRRYRAVIENLDSPPLEINGVSVKGEMREGVFLCGDGPHRVVYGADDVEALRYDMDRIVSGVAPDKMATYLLGQETANVPYRKSRFAWLRSGKALLVPAVLLMVAVLAWILVKTVHGVSPSDEAM